MFASPEDSALLAGMSAAQREERMATARRILLAGSLFQNRTAGLVDGDRAQWCIDNWEAVAAEVGAELGISRRRASAQMNYGVELLERLPRLGAVFAAGEVDFRVIAAAVFRTGLITDPQLLARIDATLARSAPGWNRLSQKRLTALIDMRIVALDPAALRTARSAEEERHIDFGEVHNGMVKFWGVLRAADAAVLEHRLEQLATEVTEDDSRTKDQRRADALIDLAAGGVPGRPGQVVIHVLAEAATLNGDSDKPGYLLGYGTIPPAMLREVAKTAKLRPLNPAALICPERRYRPSAALAEYIRCRDMHCRFPGCDKPAEYCDIDHTVPWQLGGPTHPSNLALLCRTHHLLKTFITGENGWAERQYGDGRIAFTSPSGRTYTTTPSGALFFPQLTAPTGRITLEDRRAACGAGRTLMMPARKRTRAAERAARIAWERGLNEAKWAADPPPF